ncbi:MAG: hypothetical protein ABIS86_01445 [Streptosporangiaceae bacterium]
MVVAFQNSPAKIEEDFKLYYSDAHGEGDVDPNALFTIGERLDTADLYTLDEMDALADVFLAEAGGEAIAKVLAPIKNRWSGRRTQARLNKDKDSLEALRRFRADLISNGWQFLSQIVHYQGPELHRRAILATLLGRNLYMDGNQADVSFMEGVGVHAAVLRCSDQSADVHFCRPRGVVGVSIRSSGCS